MEVRRREDIAGGCWELICICPRCGDALALILPDEAREVTEEAAEAEAREEAGDAYWSCGKDGHLVCPECRA